MTRDEKRSCNNCMYRRVCRTCRDCGDMAWCCSTYTHYIDREKLLALADELEQETGSVCGVCMGKTARRIREALGENDDY